MFNHVLAIVHLCALACGIAVLFQRAAALRAAHDASHLGKVLFWDNLAGLTAIVWIGSGLLRALGGYDKGGAYYLNNWLFWLDALLLHSIAQGVPSSAMPAFGTLLSEAQQRDALLFVRGRFGRRARQV